MDTNAIEIKDAILQFNGFLLKRSKINQFKNTGGKLKLPGWKESREMRVYLIIEAPLSRQVEMKMDKASKQHVQHSLEYKRV